jgi:hypothetical protein
LEEGGITATVTALVGVQELPSAWQGWIALLYDCEHLAGEPRPDGIETDAAGYFSAEEINLLREPIEPWTAWLLQRAFSVSLTRIERSAADNPFHPATAFL